jgi:hypothetical protein
MCEDLHFTKNLKYYGATFFVATLDQDIKSGSLILLSK